ncbi:MAG: hypothetical protein V1914_03480 [archaeon]
MTQKKSPQEMKVKRTGDKESIRKLLEKQRKKQCFFKSINLDDTAERTEASICLQTHELELRYPKDWMEKFSDKKLEEYLKKRNIPKNKALESILSDTLSHEIGHRGAKSNKGCPETADKYTEQFIEPIQETTQTEDKQTIHHLANCLTDIIDNTLIKKTGGSGLTNFTGMYMFFHEQAKLSEGKFSKLYEAHVRLNIFFNGDKTCEKLLKSSFTYDDKINKAIQNFLQKTGISDMKTTIYTNATPIEAKDREKIRNYLENEENWKTISQIYAEEMSKLLDEPPKEKLFGASTDPSEGESSREQADGKEGESSGEQADGKKGKDESSGDKPEEEGKDSDSEKKDREQGTYFLDEDKFQKGDGFGEELNKKETQKKAIRRGLKAGKNPGWMTNFEYMVGLYEILASDKTFELTPPEMQSKTYPLIDLTQRTFEFENDQASDLLGMHFDEDEKDLELSVGSYKHNVTAKVKKDMTNCPEFIFGLLDTSSSMLCQMPRGPEVEKTVNPKGKVQWNFNSKYHVSLVAYFMAVQRFNELGIFESDVHFANFSYETLVNQGLKRSLYNALHPQFGGTQINMRKVEELMTKRGTLIFTISDGEIGNDSQLLEKILEISEYNPYFHIQMGEHSGYSRGLLRNGLHVKQVMSEQDLYEFVLDMTDEVYGGKR